MVPQKKYLLLLLLFTTFVIQESITVNMCNISGSEYSIKKLEIPVTINT